MRQFSALLRASVGVALQYRAAVLWQVSVTVMWVLLLTQVWRSVYAGRPTLAGFDLDQTIVYITLANLAAMLLTSALPQQIADRVRTGEVVFDISRPVGYLRQLMAMQAGNSLTTVGFVLAATPFAALAGGLAAPADAVAGVAAFGAVLLGWVLSAVLSIMIGLMAFWLVENEAFVLLYRLVAAFLAGSMVPLAFFPGPLRTIADVLPFRFIVNDPAAIYVGHISGGAIWVSLGLAAVWIGVLGLAVVGMWRTVHKRLVVQGG